MSGLGARAVACKCWRWMPGMKLDAESETYRLTYIYMDELDEVRPILEAPDGWGWPRKGSGWLPDLDDHATLGCIEHGLLPEAWPGCDIRLSKCGQVVKLVVFEASSIEPVFCIADVPLTEALLLALEASPANQEAR